MSLAVKGKLLRLMTRQAFLILAATFVPALVSVAFHPRKPEFRRPELRPGEVTLPMADAWGKAVVWVDARPEDDFAHGHVPGAVRLNLEEWSRLFPVFLDQWQPTRMVVVYCSSRDCGLSSEVAKRLRGSRISPTYVLHGGWDAWRNRHPESVATGE
jgi:rhodanese-related sulfurtransferase